jgi:hypothetical protein
MKHFLALESESNISQKINLDSVFIYLKNSTKEKNGLSLDIITQNTGENDLFFSTTDMVSLCCVVVNKSNPAMRRIAARRKFPSMLSGQANLEFNIFISNAHLPKDSNLYILIAFHDQCWIRMTGYGTPMLDLDSDLNP